MSFLYYSRLDVLDNRVAPWLVHPRILTRFDTGRTRNVRKPNSSVPSLKCIHCDGSIDIRIGGIARRKRVSIPHGLHTSGSPRATDRIQFRTTVSPLWLICHQFYRFQGQHRGEHHAWPIPSFAAVDTPPATPPRFNEGSTVTQNALHTKTQSHARNQLRTRLSAARDSGPWTSRILRYPFDSGSTSSSTSLCG